MEYSIILNCYAHFTLIVAFVRTIPLFIFPVTSSHMFTNDSGICPYLWVPECQNEHECGGRFLHSCEGHQTKAG